LGVQIKYLLVGGLDGVVLEHGAKAADYATLPIDQAPVAVEANDIVAVEADHEKTAPGDASGGRTLLSATQVSGLSARPPYTTGEADG
jgi:hypothetical protein